MNILEKPFDTIGRYFVFLRKVFRRPENYKLYWKQFVMETDKLVMSSVPILAIISLFIGGVVVIQTASNLENPFIDKMYVGYMVRESLILEFCSTLIGVILAGKMGSHIASEIGSMRITEQIDAMDMMGVNSAAFLVMPKILSATIFAPFIMMTSFVLGLVGAYIAVAATGIIRVASYVEGICFCYNGFYVFYSAFKTAVFCFIVSSIASFEGYYATGGSIGVGKSSTRTIVYCSVLIMMFDLIITQLMLY